MGSASGSVATAAKRLGITVKAYEAQVAAGRKWCTRCKKWHRRQAFGRDSSRNDGLAASCSASRATSVDQPGRRERRLAQGKGLAWCSDCAAWLPADAVQQGRCREHLNASARAWYARNPDPVRPRKSANRRGLVPVPAWWRDSAFERFAGQCAYGCGRAADALDHITPVAKGGLSEPANLVPACKSCNSSKRDFNPAPWVVKGCLAFPDEWFDIAALAAEVGQSTAWSEAA